MSFVQNGVWDVACAHAVRMDLQRGCPERFARIRTRSLLMHGENDWFSSFPVTVMTMMTMYGSEGETVITVIIVIQLKFW